MAKTADYEIVGSYNNQRVTSIDAERTVNMFEYIDPLGKKPRTLINSAGLTNTNINLFGATGGYRQQFVFNNTVIKAGVTTVVNVEFDVIGNTVVGINPDNTSFLLGHIHTDTGYVGIAANTFQIIFVDGQDGWIWDTIANTFVQITDPSFPPDPIDVAYLDEFFIVAHGGTNEFQLSALDNGLIWGPGTNTFTMAGGGNANIVLTSSNPISYQIGTPVVFSGGALPAEITAGTTYYVAGIVSATTFTVSATQGGAAITSGAGGSGSVTNGGQLQQGTMTSDNGTIVACRTLHRRLFLFSQFFTEVWENLGVGTNLPFRRNNSLLIEYGTPAIGTISISFDMMFFLSQSRKGLGPVMQITGVQPIPVSNRALDFQFSQYSALQQLADCRGFLIKENGLIFYRMNFTLANHTYVYNVTFSEPSAEATKVWHEEEVLDGDRHPAQTNCFFAGNNYVGNYKSPIRYLVDNTNFTNDGEAIRRMRITKAVVPPGYQRIRVDRLQVDLLQGGFYTTIEDVFLITENGFNLDTEDGFDLILEQQLSVDHIEQLILYLSISKDGGQTYGSVQDGLLGLVGNRTARTVYRKLGVIPRGQAFVAKFEFYAPIPFIILGASWAIEILPE